MLNIREIPLSQGMVAIVDDADYECVSQHSWYAGQSEPDGCWYAMAYIKNKKSPQRMHRFLTGVVDPKVLVDHKNRNSLDNRRGNLRVSNKSQNSANHKLSKSNTSGYYGVVFDKSRGKWKAQIMVDRKNINLGRFDSQHVASIVRDRAAILYFGEFAVLNNEWLCPSQEVSQ